MEAREYERMAEAEQRSWWFRGRRRVLNEVIERLPLSPESHILDIGCGTGGNLSMLARHGQVTGVEFSEQAAAIARGQEAGEIVVGAAEKVPLEEGGFHLVTLLDVLEHLDDEAPALAEVRRLLVPGGYLLVTVPAFMMLWSGHDVALHHRRRYRRPELKGRLQEAGLEIQWLTYYNTALFPAVAGVRLTRRLLGGGADEADVADDAPGPLSGVLEGLFAAERHIVGRLPLPFGVSLVGVAREPDPGS